MSIIYRSLFLFFIVFSCESYRTPFQSPAFYHQKEHRYTIMISPHGDSKSAGRSTPDGAERGVTRLWAEHIKTELESSNPHIRVVFSHDLGEHITQQEKANFANRLQIDLFISLLCYADDQLALTLYYHGDTSGAHIQPKKLSFCKQHDAHIFAANHTPLYTDHLYKTLGNNQAMQQISIKTPCNVPLHCLKGVKAPAIACEIGLKQSGDWRYYVQPIVQALDQLIQLQD